MTHLHLDFETRATVDLKKTGVHAYAEHHDTDVWCMAYAFGDDEIKLWTPTGEYPDIPDEIAEHIAAGGLIFAHNAPFERAIAEHLCRRKYGWPHIPVEQWRCTMAMALAMSLPASLENAAAGVGLDTGKDMTGHDLMLRMAKPRSRDSNGRPVWWDVDERKQRLYAYCIQDVEVERQLHKRLLPLSPDEQQLWFIDQRINDRGVYVDTKLCEQALKIVDEMAKRNDGEMALLTGYEVTSCSNTNQMMAWVRSKGVEADSIAKDQIVDILARADIPGDVRRALELRLEANKASVKKIKALLNARSRDGRARGLVQFHAASTGRWGGRRFQPQNIKRPTIKDVPSAIKAVMSGRAAAVEALFDDPVLSIVGDCLRGMVRAAPGNVLHVSDFANIEGRGLAWLAGEESKLEAFRRFDRGEGPDLYKVAAGKTFGVKPESIDKSDPRRQVGKVQELAFGYQGGPNAFRTMARSNGVDMAEAAEVVLSNMSEHAIWEAGEMWALLSKADKVEWVEDQWLAAKCLVNGWRNAHPNTVDFWQAMEDAAIAAVEAPGAITHAGKLQFRKNGSFLFMRLPSKRCLCYPYPRVEEIRTPWGKLKPAVVFKGVDTYTRKWGDRKTYGGLWAENATQAVARDVLRDAIVRCEAAGYASVLHVHDENVAEVEAGSGDQAEFDALMAVVPPWAEGFPIAVEGWSEARYRK